MLAMHCFSLSSLSPALMMTFDATLQGPCSFLCPPPFLEHAAAVRPDADSQTVSSSPTFVLLCSVSLGWASQPLSWLVSADALLRRPPWPAQCHPLSRLDSKATCLLVLLTSLVPVCFCGLFAGNTRALEERGELHLRAGLAAQIEHILSAHLNDFVASQASQPQGSQFLALVSDSRPNRRIGFPGPGSAP